VEVEAGAAIAVWAVWVMSFLETNEEALASGQQGFGPQLGLGKCEILLAAVHPQNWFLVLDLDDE
jgi:hypothetical protein